MQIPILKLPDFSAAVLNNDIKPLSQDLAEFRKIQNNPTSNSGDIQAAAQAFIARHGENPKISTVLTPQQQFGLTIMASESSRDEIEKKIKQQLLTTSPTAMLPLAILSLDDNTRRSANNTVGTLKSLRTEINNLVVEGTVNTITQNLGKVPLTSEKMEEVQGLFEQFNNKLDNSATTTGILNNPATREAITQLPSLMDKFKNNPNKETQANLIKTIDGLLENWSRQLNQQEAKKDIQNTLVGNYGMSKRFIPESLRANRELFQTTTNESPISRMRERLSELSLPTVLVSGLIGAGGAVATHPMWHPPEEYHNPAITQEVPVTDKIPPGISTK